MAGIYIHIPFCKQACSYCNFYFSTTAKNQNQVVEAIIKEIHLRKDEVQEPISSIYFGGGTPSVLQVKTLQKIFDAVALNYNFADNLECTIEANPDDLSQLRIAELKNTNINRFSIGIQSFFDVDLRLMNRAHQAHEAEKSVKLVQDAGFKNISIDLIYGSPTTSHAMWQDNVGKALALQVQHISAYALTVEPKTLLAHQIQTQRIPAIDEQKQAKQFHYLRKKLLQNNWQHYELSNFSLPNFESKHNSAYWQQKSYLGFGPSAHSYHQNQRSWNIANNQQYLRSLQQYTLPLEFEVLGSVDRFNELIMIGLRTKNGVDLLRVKQNFPKHFYFDLIENAKQYLLRNQLQIKNNHLILNSDYWFFADGIAADLFVV